MVHAELAGLVDSAGDAARNLSNGGKSMDAVRETLDRITQGQSVMLSINAIMGLIAIAFAIAACFVLLAPRSTRAVDMTKAGHS